MPSKKYTKSKVKTSSTDVSVSIENIVLPENGNDGIIDVYISNSEIIGGFQFELTGITISGYSGGLVESNNWQIATTSDTVIGYRFSGLPIPPSCDRKLLVQIYFSDYSGDEICFGSDPTNNVFSPREPLIDSPLQTGGFGSCYPLNLKSQIISLLNGWNLVSFNVVSDNPNLLSEDGTQGIFRDLTCGGLNTEDNHLVKVFDERGEVIEQLTFLPEKPWNNTIGDIINTEG